MTRRSRIRRGMTMVEVVTAASISTLVITGALTIFLSGMRDWARGTQRIDAETQSRQAVRAIASTLRGARQVVVAGDGQSLTFRLPPVSANGMYQATPDWDGVNRSLLYNNGNLIYRVAGSDRILARNVVVQDPLLGSGSAGNYRIFTPSTGVITRQLTVKVVCQVTSSQGKVSLGRKRESVYLRNIPLLTK